MVEIDNVRSDGDDYHYVSWTSWIDERRRSKGSSKQRSWQRMHQRYVVVVVAVAVGCGKEGESLYN